LSSTACSATAPLEQKDDQMELSSYLTTSQVLDCQGRVAATFTLEIDGAVTIQVGGGRKIRIDPNHRLVLTAGAHVEDSLLDQACAFAKG